MKLAKRDNAFRLMLTIIGELPTKEEVEQVVGTSLRSFKRKDEVKKALDTYYRSLPRKSKGDSEKRAAHDVAAIELVTWSEDAKSREMFESVIPMLQNWLPAFRQFAADYQASFHLSLMAARYSDTGGIEFPDDFLRILVEAKISFGISIQARFLWVD